MHCVEVRAIERSRINERSHREVQCSEKLASGRTNVPNRESLVRTQPLLNRKVPLISSRKRVTRGCCVNRGQIGGARRKAWRLEIKHRSRNRQRPSRIRKSALV